MKTKDDILLEQAYATVVKENHQPLTFKFGSNYDKSNSPNIGYSDKISVRGKDVLVKSEYDCDEDSEWYYLSLVDPETKERVFTDIKEPYIKRLIKGDHIEDDADEYGFSNKMSRDQQIRNDFSSSR